jgi:hypothetical protein
MDANIIYEYQSWKLLAMPLLKTIWMTVSVVSP